MQWRDLLQCLVRYINEKLRRVETSPPVSRALVVMDTGIQYMADRHYASRNAALAEVRAPLVVGLWVILGLFSVILLWGTLAPIDSAAVARGSVVLLSSKKTVQHLEGGVIQKISVKEGDKVAAGQELMRLNPAAAQANRDALQGQLAVARAGEARLVAERDQQEKVTFAADMVEAAKTNPELAKAMEAQERLFASEREAEQAKLGVLTQRIAQSQEEIEGFKAQIEGASSQIDLLGQEIETVETLLGKGYATKTRLFELKRNQSELQGRRGDYSAQIAKAQQNIAETQMQIINQQKEFESAGAKDLRDAQAQVNEFTDKLHAANDILARTVITAPYAGVVMGLKYHTVGGVVTPGSPIMDIVPQDDQLIIEAKVKPNDIDNVHAGLNARIVFTAFKARNTPKIPGTVTQVSADAFTEERNPQAGSYYLARIEVDKDFLQSLDKHLELYPGMPADVLITTGSRSFLSYLFSPLTDSMHSAFREK